MTTDLVPIAEDLFTLDGPDGPQLLGGRCVDCGTVTFPRQRSCPRCTGRQMAEMALPRRGTLWTWTIQGFCPKPPYAGPAGDAFTPYGVGYVELPGQVIVESRLTEADPSRLHIGQEMELVLEPFGTDGTGRPVVTFAFAPVH